MIAIGQFVRVKSGKHEGLVEKVVNRNPADKEIKLRNVGWFLISEVEPIEEEVDDIDIEEDDLDEILED